MVEPGESPEAAIRREICEEWGYRAREVELFTEYRLVMPFPEPRLERLTFFAIPICEAEVRNFVLNEGADLRLFRPEELSAEARAAPWDLAAVMHARREIVFRPAGPRYRRKSPAPGGAFSQSDFQTDLSARPDQREGETDRSPGESGDRCYRSVSRSITRSVVRAIIVRVRRRFVSVDMVHDRAVADGGRLRVARDG